MNLKPILLGLAAAALVTTAVVHFTQEGDLVTFAPAPVVEAVPAPLTPVRPAPVVQAACPCPQPVYAASVTKPAAKAKHHAKAKHPAPATH